MNETFFERKDKNFDKWWQERASSVLPTMNHLLRRLSRTKFNSGNQSFSLEIQILANHVTLEKQFSKFLPDNFRIIRQSRQQLKPINSKRKLEKLLVHILGVLTFKKNHQIELADTYFEQPFGRISKM